MLYKIILLIYNNNITTTLLNSQGGTGAFGLSLATKYPSMDVTVSDLDHVVNSRHHFLSNDLPQNLKFESSEFGPVTIYYY